MLTINRKEYMEILKDFNEIKSFTNNIPHTDALLEDFLITLENMIEELETKLKKIN